MASLQVRSADFSVTKTKALEDAKKMQAAVHDECAKAGQEIPPYQLQELIGKGSFGRVYKAADVKTNKVVAVKIIDIEESDTLNPKLADTYSEFLKEVTALKLLSDGNARNVNLVLDALPVGQAMWMVTEYCAGGSVATLMKPTAPGGLQEKWIIPILREVAVAIYWVHKAGIIHRDIKCANVLVTEDGQVQLCDFGVAGVVETKFDKRSTFIGTPHWMAPELFDASASYGTEVDIWAFGSMVYEIASGLPPNVMAGVGIEQLGSYLKSHTPRLEGDQYSDNLKDLVAFCLVEDPAQRPPIEAIQRHPYIHNTEQAYPTSDLATLVRGYKLWEAQGGSRKSLFAMGGAQGPSDYSSTALSNDEWNFSTTLDFDRSVMEEPDADQAVYDVYGTNVDFEFNEDTSRPATAKPKSRRRPPANLPAIKAPIEKIFDPNTISTYDENSRMYYHRLVPPPPPPPAPTPASDLPLREETRDSSLRESLIDLDASLHGSDLSRFADMDTIKAAPAPPRISIGNGYHFDDMTPDFNNPPLSDPADLKDKRATQDWKFPSMAPPASANPEMFRFPIHEERGPGMMPLPNVRPPLIHQATEPILPSQNLPDLMVPRVADNRISVSSLIDLDESMDIPEFTRPSTANSETASFSGSERGGGNPFELERYPSLYAPTFTLPQRGREPSIYVSDDSNYPKPYGNGHHNQDSLSFHASDTSASANGDSNPSHSRASSYASYSASEYPDTDYLAMRHPAIPPPQEERTQDDEEGHGGLPPVPNPPSVRVMQGMGGRDDVREEMMRLLSSFGEHLAHASRHVGGLPVRKAGRQGLEEDRE